MSIDTDAAMGELFKVMGRVRSCSEIGPHLKLMRWMSVNEVWERHKRESFALRPVLRQMAADAASGIVAAAVIVGTTRGATDGDVQVALVNVKGGGGGEFGPS